MDLIYIYNVSKKIHSGLFIMTGMALVSIMIKKAVFIIVNLITLTGKKNETNSS
jgi:hypothetical protein